MAQYRGAYVNPASLTFRDMIRMGWDRDTNAVKQKWVDEHKVATQCEWEGCPFTDLPAYALHCDHYIPAEGGGMVKTANVSIMVKRSEYRLRHVMDEVLSWTQVMCPTHHALIGGARRRGGGEA